jgi:hypothetical protein
MILAIGTLLFNIVSALIRVPIECSLRIGVLVLEVDTLEALLLERTEGGGGVEGALSSESESDSEGILYYLSSSSSLSLLERLTKESAGSDSSLDNLKSGKLNKI